MRNLFCSISLFLLLTPSFGYSQSTPQEVNVLIQEATDSLYTMASLWSSTFLDQFNGTQQYGELTPIRTDMLEFIDQELTVLKGLSDISGSVKLQEAMIALFAFEQNFIKNDFEPFEKLPSGSSDEQVNNCRARLKEESVKEKEYLNKLNTERKEYTTRNGIPLVPPPPPKNTSQKKPTTTAKQAPTAPHPAISQPVIKKVAPKDEEKEEKEKDENKTVFSINGIA